jgi:hypothetical protein
MSFTLNHFRDLAEQYTTWDALSAYLQSDAGGKLRIIFYPADKLAIIRYVKGVSDMNSEYVRMFRSVVWNTESNRPVCVAPVKAEPSNIRAPEKGRYWVSEFVDGVMVSVFRIGDGNPQIVTRTNLGGHNTFYTEKTFGEMFREATPGDINWKDILQPNTFVSCVVQHPDHKVVLQIREPRLAITQVGTVNTDGQVTIKVTPADWPTSIRGLAPFHFSNFNVLMIPNFRSYRVKGHIVQDMNSFHRYRLMNEDYEMVRGLRGSESDTVHRFLRLRKDGKVKEYLSYFREESSEMWNLEQQFRQKTHDLFEAYGEVNKAKTKTMKDIPIPFRTPVFKLQGQYLASLPKDGEENKKPIPVRKETVVSYVNGLTVDEQAGILQA